MHYLLMYDVVEDYATRRMPFRGAHLSRARAAVARGELLLGGALADPADAAILLFQGPSPDVAEAFARSDPYVLNGLVTRWRVRRWTTVVGPAAAEPIPRQESPMQMPQLTEPHRRLAVLVGSWRGEETLQPSPWDPKGGTAIGEVRNSLALDGFAVVQDYAQARGGQVTFRGHGVFRWDQEAQEYVLHWFDSMGQAPTEFRGTFVDGVLTLSSAQPHGMTRAAFDFRRSGQYEYRMEVSPDGHTWHPFMTGTYQLQR